MVAKEASNLIETPQRMTMQPRKTILPVVVAVWAIAGSVGIHTVTALPWIIDYYDFQARSALVHAGIATLYRYGYPFGAVLAFGILMAGVWFLRQREVDATRVAWFGAAGLVISTIWFIWTLLVERSLYSLLLPA